MAPPDTERRKGYGPGATLVMNLLFLPITAVADDLESQLERNMRVYSHAPGSYSQSRRIAPEPPSAAPQAEMVVYDRLGRARSPKKVALGAMPPPAATEPPLTEYPRNPRSRKPAYEIEYSMTGGYREDRLNWNIAASPYPPYYFGNPNVLSELKWENIRVAQIGGKAEITSPKGWHFQGKVDYGWVTNGKNQDSDYFGNDRTNEFSRSNNTSDGGHMLDASVGAGYRFAWRDDDGKPLATAAPLAGYSYHEQNLKMTEGFQTIPPLGPFYGLDSRYSTQWHGPWLGLRATAKPQDWMELFGQFEYHWMNYYAKANWNLRGDFQHPYSFKHYADGDGIMANAGMRFSLTPSWALELGAHYTAMLTDPGTDTTYFSNGYRLSTRLSKAQWDSWGADAGLRYRY